MVPSKALAQLAVRKRFLQAESEAYRLVLVSECSRILGPSRWWQRLRPLWVAAPMLGFWLTRRSSGFKRWFMTGWGAVRLIQAVRGYVRRPARTAETRLAR